MDTPDDPDRPPDDDAPLPGPVPPPPGQPPLPPAPGEPGWGAPPDVPVTAPPPAEPTPYVVPTYQQAYGQPPYPPPAERTDGFAIAALILGIVPLCAGVLAFVFGAVSLSRIKRDPTLKGRGLAIAGMVIAGVWLALAAGLFAVGMATDAFDDTAGSSATSPSSSVGGVAYEQLEVGDCTVGLPQGERVLTVEVLPCEQPHALEVYLVEDVTQLADGSAVADDYPGTEAMVAAVEQLCLDGFEGYVGVPIEETSLDVNYVYPQRFGFAEHKRAVCFVGDPGFPDRTGSLRGAP